MAGQGARGPKTLQRPPTERELIAQQIADRLHPAMTALGFVFLLVVTGQALARPGALQVTLQVAVWAIWSVFVVEFVLRLIVAPSTARFLRRNWWQAALLAVPFLSFLRMVFLVRMARAGRIVSSAVRATRTAAGTLRNRLLWIAVIHAIVVLGGSQLAFEFGDYDSLADAMHDVAMSATVGEPVGQPSPSMQVLEVLLAVYSVAVFASLAGTLGAYFLERRSEESGASGREGRPAA